MNAITSQLLPGRRSSVHVNDAPTLFYGIFKRLSNHGPTINIPIYIPLTHGLTSAYSIFYVDSPDPQGAQRKLLGD